MPDPYLEDFNQYLLIVGKYINEFTDLEHRVGRLCFDYSETTERAYRVFMAKRTQLGDMLGVLKKLIALQHFEDGVKVALRDAFNQLDHLIALRHRMVHHGGHPLDTRQILIRLKGEDISKETKKNYDLYDLQELRDALIDLNLIGRILMYRLDRTLGAEFRAAAAVNGVRHEPWRYKGRELLPR